MYFLNEILVKADDRDQISYVTHRRQGERNQQRR